MALSRCLLSQLPREKEQRQQHQQQLQQRQQKQQKQQQLRPTMTQPAEGTAAIFTPLGIPSSLWRSLSSFVPLDSDGPQLVVRVPRGPPAAGEDTASPEGAPSLGALGAVDAGAILYGGAAPWSYVDAAVFAGESLLVESGASLVGGGLLLCGGGGNTELRGTVDASRRGCQPLHGPGAGSRGVSVESSLSSSDASTEPSGAEQSALCGGGGGGHVGAGGDGVHALTGKACRGSGGLSYDRRPRILLPGGLPAARALANDGFALTENNNPTLFASTASASGGGGDLARAGSGGGFVWVQGQTVRIDGQVTADGGGGELMQEAIIDVEVDPEDCPPLPSSPLSETLKGPPDAAAEAKPGGVDAASSGPTPGETTGESAAPDGALQPPGVPPAASEAPLEEVLAAQETTDAAERGPTDPKTPNEATPTPTLDSVSCQLSGILADPAQLGQGGGAGGSIVIEAGALKGHGTISAQGGHGGRCTGGGGGGGAINFLWDTSLHYWGRGPTARQQRGRRSSRNGRGSRNSRSRRINEAGTSNSLIREEAAEKEEELEDEQEASAFIPWLKPLDYAGGFVGSLKYLSPQGLCA
ncbi:uncharacterized protein EMH_0086220 [Eimeria mitis]|uniref:Uncharacterized protein n=1 Tax=Eimeria mitis TaxID=44415 RepID=U6KCG1_9EIME|nr:uncharacterized protein EMH_0086220 [Eimeria mitis]CDJ33897.1 hypothetical protein EMH_0086220 [Eimeria mitis]